MQKKKNRKTAFRQKLNTYYKCVLYINKAINHSILMGVVQSKQIKVELEKPKQTNRRC